MHDASSTTILGGGQCAAERTGTPPRPGPSAGAVTGLGQTVAGGVPDSISQYLPVVIITGLAAMLFMIGYARIGVTMIGTATLPRWTGVLVAHAAGS
jgi:hypothetical protein